MTFVWLIRTTGARRKTLCCLEETAAVVVSTCIKFGYFLWKSAAVGSCCLSTAPYTGYKVQVAAVTNGGTGEFSDQFPALTDVAG